MYRNDTWNTQEYKDTTITCCSVGDRANVEENKIQHSASNVNKPLLQGQGKSVKRKSSALNIYMKKK